VAEQPASRRDGSAAEIAAEEAGVGAASPPPPQQPAIPAGLNRPLITVSVMAATIMQAIDSTIANVALPKMQGTLSATQDQMAWVLTSYIIAAAIMIPLTGWLAGRLGRKPVFLVSIASFTIASALCGMATSLPQIVMFRLLQGMSGAALVPLSQAILFDINTPENFGKAMAAWGVGVTMGPILGPALGGWLTDNYSWRWVFYINVPIGILAFLGLSASMPNTTKRIMPFDFFGFITLSLTVGALQMMLDRGQLKDWFSSNEIVIYAIVAGIAFYLFMIHTATHHHPFLSLALFTDRNFVSASFFIFVLGVVLFATLALIPPMLQQQMGYPVVTTGLVTAPRGAGTMAAMMVLGRISNKVDPRIVMATGMILTVISLWQMTHFDLLMSYGPIITSGLLQGFGIGLTWVSLSTLAFATLPAALRNEGTALFNLLRNIGSAIGISVVEFMLTRNIQVLHAGMASHITPYSLGDPAYAANHIDPTSTTGLQILDGMINRQAAMIGYVDDFWLMMVISIVVIPLLFLVRAPKHKPAGGHDTAVMD
jgi:DHA2 family multidrug resistance protein